MNEMPVCRVTSRSWMGQGSRAKANQAEATTKDTKMTFVNLGRARRSVARRWLGLGVLGFSTAKDNRLTNRRATERRALPAGKGKTRLPRPATRLAKHKTPDSRQRLRQRRLGRTATVFFVYFVVPSNPTAP